MGIFLNDHTMEFHLYNDEISYLMKVMRNGQMGQLYFGKRVPLKDDYGYLIENYYRPVSAYRSTRLTELQISGFLQWRLHSPTAAGLQILSMFLIKYIKESQN